LDEKHEEFSLAAFSPRRKKREKKNPRKKGTKKRRRGIDAARWTKVPASMMIQKKVRRRCWLFL
jgi:hypothetical protein